MDHEAKSILMSLNREVGEVGTKVESLAVRVDDLHGKIDGVEVDVTVIRSGMVTKPECAINMAALSSVTEKRMQAEEREELIEVVPLMERARKVMTFILLTGALLAGLGTAVIYLVRIGGKVDRVLQMQSIVIPPDAGTKRHRRHWNRPRRPDHRHSVDSPAGPLPSTPAR